MINERDEITKVDIEDIVEEYINEKNNNEKFDAKYNELEEFCCSNYKKQKQIYINELRKILKELSFYSRHRCANLLTQDNLFPFVSQKTHSAVRFYKVFLIELQKAIGIKKQNKAKRQKILAMIEKANNQNRLIRKLENYLIFKHKNSNKYELYSKMIESFEKYLISKPILRNFIDDALKNEDNNKTLNNLELLDNYKENIVRAYKKSEYNNAIGKFRKNPQNYEILFPHWQAIGNNFDFIYKTGKRKDEINDSKIIEWILEQMGFLRKKEFYKTAKFRQIQRRWMKFKNS